MNNSEQEAVQPVQPVSAKDKKHDQDRKNDIFYNSEKYNSAYKMLFLALIFSFFAVIGYGFYKGIEDHSFRTVCLYFRAFWRWFHRLNCIWIICSIPFGGLYFWWFIYHYLMQGIVRNN